MKIKEANTLVGGLSNPSKMPGHSYGLPAGEAAWVPQLALDNDMNAPKEYGCKVGGKLQQVKGSTCASCYATKGMYFFKNTKLAQLRRANSITHPDWVAAMSLLINSKKSKYFRWHDSGDVVNMQHLKNIVEVCNRTPSVSHWLPTRESKLITEYKKTIGAFPGNLCVRISATKVDGKPSKVHGVTSTVHSKEAPYHGVRCIAPDQGGECGDCRKCWDINVGNVSYGIH